MTNQFAAFLQTFKADQEEDCLLDGSDIAAAFTEYVGDDDNDNYDHFVEATALLFVELNDVIDVHGLQILIINDYQDLYARYAVEEMGEDEDEDEDED